MAQRYDDRVMREALEEGQQSASSGETEKVERLQATKSQYKAVKVRKGSSSTGST